MAAKPNPNISWSVFVLTDDGAVCVAEYARTRVRARAQAAGSCALPFISDQIVVVSNHNWPKLHAMYNLVGDEIEARYGELSPRERRHQDRIDRLDWSGR